MNDGEGTDGDGTDGNGSNGEGMGGEGMGGEGTEGKAPRSECREGEGGSTSLGEVGNEVCREAGGEVGSGVPLEYVRSFLATFLVKVYSEEANNFEHVEMARVLQVCSPHLVEAPCF